MRAVAYSQAIELGMLIGDQVGKSVSGMLALATDPTTSVSWVQTGILGVVVLGIVWGFKTGFLALGREVANKQAELERALADGEKKDAIIKDQRNTIAAVILQSGRTLPVLTETAKKVAEDKDEQAEKILGMLDELKEAIAHGAAE